MIGLFWNLILATAWVFLTGSFEFLNYVFGFTVGYLVLTIIHQQVPILTGYPQRIPKAILFGGFFIRELFQANIKVAVDIVTPPWHMKPGVIGLSLEASTDLEIAMVANFISLTPGTLSLEVSEDRTLLFVHAMFMHDEDQVRRDLKNMERRVLEILR